MPPDIFATIARLRAEGTPFVLATVVASHPPQSVRPGAKAIVYADGTVDGWIGGGCVRPVVLQEAAEALGDGRPRLVRMNAEGVAAAPAQPVRHPSTSSGQAVKEYPMTCQGEGGVEIYLEPVLASPRLVILGHTPVAQSLARMGAELGFEVVVGSRSATEPHAAELFPRGTRVESELAAALGGAGASSWVVVATMGAGDEEALAAAAASDAAYVGLVASRKKARFLLDYLRASGLPADRLAGVKFPAGLDLGGMTAPEIALSILAEIVQRRHARTRGAAESSGKPSPAPAPPPARTSRAAARTVIMAPFPVDPVCGMPVEPAGARHTLVEGGKTVYFCCPHCLATYERRRRETQGANA